MRRLALGVAVLGAVAGASARAMAQPLEDWDDQAVARAIERGKEFLWSRWNEREGHWPEHYGRRGSRRDGPGGCNFGGETALALYALLAAGESPQDPRMKRSLAWLAKVPMHGVYARGFRANVWGMLGRLAPYRRLLNDDMRWLVRSVYYDPGPTPKYPNGTYPYLGASPGHPQPGREDRSNWDHSNSQVAVLGVWAAARNGLEVPARYWRIVEDHWIRSQRPDGGWDYSDKPSRQKTPGRGYGSMTTAGLATLYICLDNLHGREFIKCRRNVEIPAIARGLAWMQKNFTATGNPGLRTGGLDTYYLYGVERVGLASGMKYFGKKDWYKQGAAALLRHQHGDGGWGSVPHTSFALLFLARGRRPVLFNKLQYDGTWNCRPRDLANLTRWISRQFEHEVNWQIIHLGVPVSEWHDAPVLYISGATPPKFSEADLEKLRTFVHQGGLIFSEAACNRVAFDLAMQKVYAKLFPRYELKRLRRDHPIYNLNFPTAMRGRLMGISNGVRLLAVHSPGDMSLAWQLNRYATRRDYFRLAANLYLYVTDKGSLRSRGVSHWPKPRAFTPVSTVKLAVVRHEGNFDPEPLALRRFAILMGNRHRVKVELSPPKRLTELDPAAWPVAAMTGTGSLTLSKADAQALRKYLAGGGTLIVSAAGASRPFAEAMENQLPGLLEAGSWGLIPLRHPLYAEAGPKIEKVAYRRALRMALSETGKPRLRGLTLAGRLAIIFSRDDLVAGLTGYQRWGLRGYTPESAFALMRNAVLYASKSAAR